MVGGLLLSRSLLPGGPGGFLSDGFVHRASAPAVRRVGRRRLALLRGRRLLGRLWLCCCCSRCCCCSTTVAAPDHRVGGKRGVGGGGGLAQDGSEVRRAESLDVLGLDASCSRGARARRLGRRGTGTSIALAATAAVGGTIVVLLPSSLLGLPGFLLGLLVALLLLTPAGVTAVCLSKGLQHPVEAHRSAGPARRPRGIVRRAQPKVVGLLGNLDVLGDAVLVLPEALALRPPHLLEHLEAELAFVIFPRLVQSVPHTRRFYRRARHDPQLEPAGVSGVCTGGRCVYGQAYAGHRTDVMDGGGEYMSNRTPIY